jgi:hypothetical protein
LADQKRHALCFVLLGGMVLGGAWALWAASETWFGWLGAGVVAWLGLSSWFLAACIHVARRPKESDETK